MTDKLLIDRELLERELLSVLDFSESNLRRVVDHLIDVGYTRAAPLQPEGEAISRERVQAEADAFFDWPTTDKSSVTTTSCLIFARCIAGMVAAERDATIADLRGECSFLKDCQENAMLHMTGLVAERDTLRQQLAERDATIARLEAGIPRIQEQSHQMRKQRDKLAGLLYEASGELRTDRHHGLGPRIDAALAEVGK